MELIEKYLGEGDARSARIIKVGDEGITKDVHDAHTNKKFPDGKKIKILKKLGKHKRYGNGFLVDMEGEEVKMYPGNMNRIRWKNLN